MAAGRKVVILGGGVMGSAVAFFAAMLAQGELDITVIERDPSYAKASSALSAAGIRQQFSVPANISLSAFGASFLNHAGDILAVDGERPEVGFRQAGYLLLAGEGRDVVMRENNAVQRGMGADVVLLAPEALRARFPWISTEGVVLGSLGQSGEGWFDAYGLLQGFRRKARAMGVAYVAAEAAAFVIRADRVAGVRLTDGPVLDADTVVLAAGAWSGPLAATAGVDLPVKARRRSVFAFQCRSPIMPCPLVVDTSGAWFRPEGEGRFIGGVSPEDDPDDLPLEVNHAEWDEVVWPAIATRVPAFEAVKVGRSWAGYYEYNTIDQNGVIGPHDVLANLMFCTGFSGHGVQQAPGAGRAVAEMIVHGRSSSIDVSALGWERIRDGRPLIERNVI
jgi:FAD-dependent oxidoreductase domain-containing protein 1